MTNIVGLKIEYLILQKTGSYKPVNVRPWESNVTGDMPGEMAQAISEVGLSGINEGLMSSRFSDVLAPSSMSGRNIIIPNGWEEHRITWVMKCEVELESGSIAYETYSGHTEHYGIGRGEFGSKLSVDEDMVFIIDKVHRAKVLNIRKGSGSRLSSVITTMDQVVTSRTDSRPLMDLKNERGGPLNWMMRPSDIPREASLGYISKKYQNGSNDEAIDSRSICMQPQLSSLSNGRAGSYLSKIASAFVETSGRGDYGNSKESFLPAAGSALEENELRTAALPQLLKSGSGYGVASTFSLDDLKYVDPDISRKINITDNTVKRRVSHNNDSRGWEGSDLNTVSAVTIISVMMSIMADMNLGVVAFTTVSRMMPFEGKMEYITVATDVRTSYSQASQELMEHLEARINNDLISTLTHNGLMPIDLVVDISMNNNAYIKISIDGSRFDEFDSPMFASSGFSLSVTRDRDDLSNMSSSLVSLMEEAVLM